MDIQGFAWIAVVAAAKHGQHFNVDPPGSPPTSGTLVNANSTPAPQFFPMRSIQSLNLHLSRSKQIKRGKQQLPIHHRAFGILLSQESLHQLGATLAPSRCMCYKVPAESTQSPHAVGWLPIAEPQRPTLWRIDSSPASSNGEPGLFICTIQVQPLHQVGATLKKS